MQNDLTRPGAPAALHNAGFEPWTGPRAQPDAVGRFLTRRFARHTVTGFFAASTYVSFLFGPLAVSAYILLRLVAPDFIQIEGIGVDKGGEVDFAITALGYLYTATVGWAVTLNGFFVASQVRADIQHGALLLYFSRPVHRQTYLTSRILAPALVTWSGFVVSALIVCLVLGTNLGWSPPPAFPAAESFTVAGHGTWLVAFIGFSLAGAVSSLLAATFAHGCGVAVRSAGQAPLLFFGTVVGSVALSMAGQLKWGETSLASALNLVKALEAPFFGAMRIIDPASASPPSKVAALVGLGFWIGLALLSLAALRTRLAAPPSAREHP